jgi:hypothetical protein
MAHEAGVSTSSCSEEHRRLGDHRVSEWLGNYMYICVQVLTAYCILFPIVHERVAVCVVAITNCIPRWYVHYKLLLYIHLYAFLLRILLIHISVFSTCVCVPFCCRGMYTRIQK